LPLRVALRRVLRLSKALPRNLLLRNNRFLGQAPVSQRGCNHSAQGQRLPRHSSEPRRDEAATVGLKSKCHLTPKYFPENFSGMEPPEPARDASPRRPLRPQGFWRPPERAAVESNELFSIARGPLPLLLGRRGPGRGGRFAHTCLIQWQWRRSLL